MLALDQSFSFTLQKRYTTRVTAAVTRPLRPLLWPPTWPEKRVAVMVGILSKTNPATKQSINKPGITATSLRGSFTNVAPLVR